MSKKKKITLGTLFLFVLAIIYYSPIYSEISKKVSYSTNTLPEKCYEEAENDYGGPELWVPELGYQFDFRENKCKQNLANYSSPFAHAEECQLVCEQKYTEVKHLGDGYYLVDGVSISFNGEVVENADVQSFVVLEKGYAREECPIYSVMDWHCL